MSEQTPIIEFKNVDISNSDTLVIENLSFEIFQGDFVYLTGKVGSGKTSIIRTIIAENPVTSGEARVGEFNLKGIKRKQIPYLRRSVGVVFQDFQLLMDRSVESNLEFVLKATGWNDSKAISERIDEVLQLVKLSTKAHKMPHQLSGGEQQRVAIARALLNSPELILADEPTGNLDNETAKGIMDLLYEINKTNRTAIIMVTHNQNLLKQYPGRVFLCADNTCREEVSGAIDLDIEI
ncbi:MAG: ATP-binding cassette domain-containing protein [Bacteroidales bacterium]|nr:ATP-binding cassette domain-containing protein [Bacteroidales bacterium]